LIPNVEGRVHYFLDRFYLSRISMRMLIHQHLLMYSYTDNPTRHIGCFDPSCDVFSVATDAYENARFLCEQYYNIAPKNKIRCHKPYDPIDDPITERSDRIFMTYVPAHLYYMLFELYKNALRAVVECHQDHPSLPDVETLICKGREDVTIKISDQGGGVTRSDADKLFHYMYSTAPRPPSPDAIETTPLAGYGYGLPISRLYAKYFNGDLWLNMVDGYGTDAMVSLKVFPKDASELLPVYNKTSSQRYTTSEQAKDWSEPVDGFGLHRNRVDSFKPTIH
jgi:pyruvate dehydrogenase kinase 2/3/4